MMTMITWDHVINYDYPDPGWLQLTKFCAWMDDWRTHQVAVELMSVPRDEGDISVEAAGCTLFHFVSEMSAELVSDN